MNIPPGLCIDLETTISSKVPDHIRPSGKKRYETRILEIGAVDWQHPQTTYRALVNPIPKDIPLHTTKDFFQHLQSTFQHPTRTINFWSKVLVKRKSLTRHMFSIEESPEVWLARQVDHRTKDFIRWHNDPSAGPSFVNEKDALAGLLRFSQTHSVWMAHNGTSFDFKVLQGCAERHSMRIPTKIKQIDTLKLFRKRWPGHASYSQPILFQSLFQQKYNAHVAIDDAKALAKLCKHASSPSKKSSVPKETHVKKKKPMELTFKTQQKRTPNNKSVLKLKGIGPKTAGALAAVHITTVSQLAEQYKKGGATWLRSILPYGARWKVISTSILEA